MQKLNNKFKKTSLLIYTIFLLNLSFAFSHEIDTTRTIFEKKYYEVIFDDFIYAAQDFAFVGNKILDFDKYDLLTTAGCLTITGASMTLDKGIRDNFKFAGNSSTQDFFEQINRFGTAGNASAISLATYFTGLFLRNNELRITGRLLFEGLFLSGLMTQSLKVGFGRSRPYLDEGNMRFRFIQFEDKYFSFPSGHTTIAFTIATILSHRIDTWWSYLGFYTLASTAGFARIYLDRHWASDVFLGAIIGTLGGKLVLDAEESRNTKNTKDSNVLSIMPTINGISVSYSF